MARKKASKEEIVPMFAANTIQWKEQTNPLTGLPMLVPEDNYVIHISKPIVVPECYVNVLQISQDAQGKPIAIACHTSITIHIPNSLVETPPDKITTLGLKMPSGEMFIIE